MASSNEGPYIILLKQRQLVVDVDDLDGDSALCCEICETGVMSTSSLSEHCTLSALTNVFQLVL